MEAIVKNVIKLKIVKLVTPITAFVTNVLMVQDQLSLVEFHLENVKNVRKKIAQFAIKTTRFA